MKNARITFVERCVTKLVEHEVTQPTGTQVLVKTAVSTISCGTEKANLTGCDSVSIFTPPAPAVFPSASGYSSSGTVIAVGENVTRVRVGDRVAMYWSIHDKYNLIDEKNMVVIPDEVDFFTAALTQISTFPLAAVRKVKLEIGESCLVMGLGVLGLMSVGFARAMGATPIIAVDPVESRRELALKHGADYALSPFEENFAQKVHELTNGGAKTAIEVTGLGAGLNQSLDCVAKFGRIAILGCTRDPNFTVDYYRKVHGRGVTIVGAHTLARPEFESYPHMYTQYDEMDAFLRLSKTGRIDFAKMVGEVHSPVDCSEVYDRLINDPDFPAIVQFDWDKLDI